MSALLKNNNCIGCEHYESEANDYYYQWCTHPKLEEEPEKYLTDEWGGDASEWVKFCPLDSKPPYSEYIIKEYYETGT